MLSNWVRPTLEGRSTELHLVKGGVSESEHVFKTTTVILPHECKYLQDNIGVLGNRPDGVGWRGIVVLQIVFHVDVGGMFP